MDASTRAGGRQQGAGRQAAARPSEWQAGRRAGERRLRRAAPAIAAHRCCRAVSRSISTASRWSRSAALHAGGGEKAEGRGRRALGRAGGPAAGAAEARSHVHAVQEAGAAPPALHRPLERRERAAQLVVSHGCPGGVGQRWAMMLERAGSELKGAGDWQQIWGGMLSCCVAPRRCLQLSGAVCTIARAAVTARPCRRCQRTPRPSALAPPAPPGVAPAPSQSCIAVATSSSRQRGNPSAARGSPRCRRPPPLLRCAPPPPLAAAARG